MDLDLFDYELPKGMIAQEGAVPRDSSRLFHARIGKGSSHLRFRDLPEVLSEGDLLVINRSKVIPARVKGKKPTLGRAEVLFLEEVPGGWEAIVSGKGIKEGTDILLDDPGYSIRVIKRLNEGRFLIRPMREGHTLNLDELFSFLERFGSMPTPPYVKGELPYPEMYQTIYAREEGSVAAPTAGLHFTEDVLRRLREKGVEIKEIVLHVGMGTFAPVRSQNVRDHVMEEERFFVPADVQRAVMEACQDAQKGRYRLWAVGTTVMRTLETAFLSDGTCIKEAGRSGIFIYPGYEFKLPYKGFITNFHLPRSTPLMMLCAFWNRDEVLTSYSEAVMIGYRFYSLGDSMAVQRRD
ncbi:MAG: tRNA preQ1(34) S-adenosylmethionine ribosyltransferase-isomerase QueA [Candidatus Thermoplasmatota archaeon]|nr:tRNA preQ1(34) S-adenosylmethionine ribosyltransferase-isomerase QueA [Candidatus Thermoplasmatota archaeon]